MSAWDVFILAIQLAGAVALGDFIGNWIVNRPERKAVKSLEVGAVYQDKSGGRWEIVAVSEYRHCIAYRLHSHLYDGEWYPATIQTVMIAGADVLNRHKRIEK